MGGDHKASPAGPPTPPQGQGLPAEGVKHRATRIPGSPAPGPCAPGGNEREALRRRLGRGDRGSAVPGARASSTPTPGRRRSGTPPGGLGRRWAARSEEGAGAERGRTTTHPQPAAGRSRESEEQAEAPGARHADFLYLGPALPPTAPRGPAHRAPRARPPRASSTEPAAKLGRRAEGGTRTSPGREADIQWRRPWLYSQHSVRSRSLSRESSGKVDHLLQRHR